METPAGAGKPSSFELRLLYAKELPAAVNNHLAKRPAFYGKNRFRTGNLKEQLVRLTEPDLLLRAYLEWGQDCVRRLRGDFVFAVWNRQNQQLFLARDPLGGHSVTWHRSGPTLIFASETTAVLDLPMVTPRINEDAVLKTLSYMALEHGETFFQGIHFLAV